MAQERGPLKPLIWVGSSQRDYRRFPAEVKRDMGYALFLAQQGKKHEAAKPLRGFGGAGVVALVEDHAGDTYRAVDTVRFETAVYVLHAFQKKARRGTATPKWEIELITPRLREAATSHRALERGTQR